MSDFPGTEHYREKVDSGVFDHAYCRKDLEALCDHIEDLQKQNEQAWERAALEARRVLKNGSKAQGLERKVEDRDKEIERLREAVMTARCALDDLAPNWEDCSLGREAEDVINGALKPSKAPLRTESSEEKA